MMTAQTRRSLAALLAGIAGMLMALLTATRLRQDACLDAGGRWLAAARSCELPAGAASAMSPLRGYTLGAVAGVLTAIVLWRMFTFFASRGVRRPS